MKSREAFYIEKLYSCKRASNRLFIFPNRLLKDRTSSSLPRRRESRKVRKGLVPAPIRLMRDRRNDSEDDKNRFFSNLLMS